MPPSISSPTHSPSHGPPCRRSPPFSPSASGAAADHPVSARRRPLAAQIVILHRRFPTPRSPIGLPAARRQPPAAQIGVLHLRFPPPFHPLETALLALECQRPSLLRSLPPILRSASASRVSLKIIYRGWNCCGIKRSLVRPCSRLIPQ